MPRPTSLADYQVLHPTHEEIMNGNVWLPRDCGWRSGELVKLQGHNGRGIWVSIRVIDENFYRYYCAQLKDRGWEPSFRSPDEKVLLLTEYYRTEIGLRIGLNDDLTAKRPLTSLAWYAKWRCLRRHANPMVRLTTWLTLMTLWASILAGSLAGFLPKVFASFLHWFG